MAWFGVHWVSFSSCQCLLVHFSLGLFRQFLLIDIFDAKREAYSCQHYYSAWLENLAEVCTKRQGAPTLIALTTFKWEFTQSYFTFNNHNSALEFNIFSRILYLKIFCMWVVWYGGRKVNVYICRPEYISGHVSGFWDFNSISCSNKHDSVA